MAPMITDSYLKYNSSEFGTNKTNGSRFSAAMQANENSSQQNKLVESSMNGFKLDSLQKSLLDTTRRRYTAEDTICEILRGNNVRMQIDLFEELIARVTANTEIMPIHIRQLEEFYDSLGLLLTNTLSPDVQKNCLRFLQIYFKSVEKLQFKKGQNEILRAAADELDSHLNASLVPYLITLSVSNKLQLKQLSIDLLYTYMKLTESISAVFSKFVKYGIENSDYAISKSFMDPILCIMLTDEFRSKDFSTLVKSLVKQLANPIFESAAAKCLNKIEHIVKTENFEAYIKKLPQNLREVHAAYLTNKSKPKTQQATNSLSSNNNNEILMIAEKLMLKEGEFDNRVSNNQQLKYNFVPPGVINYLAGEDEVQRLAAVKQLEASVRSLADIRQVQPYYSEFVMYLSQFVDDANYEVRLAALKILCVFIQKLSGNVNQCYKAICACARQVMSQTHQSKPIKQSLSTMLLLTIENMRNPILILDCLLDKIKDRSAKAREEFLCIIMGAILKYPSDKFEPLRKIFYQVASLLCDIKRNVRHAALECIAVIYYKLQQIDKNVNNLLDCLESASDFQNFENIAVIKEVITCRIQRNKLPTLNPDMSIEYGVKIPLMSTMYGISDLDIEWIVSATSSSGSASNISSARSHKASSVFGEIAQPGAPSIHRMASFADNNKIPISFKQRRIPSANKRLPWDQQVSTDGSDTQSPGIRPRDAAPLKAFPLTDETIDFSSGKTSYAQASSYQEKYLKKLGQSGTSSTRGSFSGSKVNSLDSQSQIIDKNVDSDLYETARRQSDKYFSLDNLYNIDDSINSENSIQKRKLANLNVKNGIIPSRPTIPRRNSATNKLQHNTSVHEQSTNELGYIQTTSQLLNNDDDDDESEFNRSTFSTNGTNNKTKYDTMPNLRTSAKNRKKLEKLFSVNGEDNLLSGNKNNDNLYLSKLKAAEKQGDLNSSRYTPSNPESGIFSMSDYEQIESSNRTFQTKQKNQQLIAQRTPQLNTNNSNTTQNNNISNINSNSEYNPLAGVSFKATHGSDVEIVGVKLGNTGQNVLGNHEQGYSHNAMTTRKKASLTGPNESSKPFGIENDDMLDIVGKGYNDKPIKQYQLRNDSENSPYGSELPVKNQPEDIDYPLSQSFQSRLRQKTQEKIQEKMNKKNEKQIDTKKEAELEKRRQSKDSSENGIISHSPSMQDQRMSPPLPNKNFGLSISGYQNQSSSSVASKPPPYNNNNNNLDNDERAIRPSKLDQQFNKPAYFNDTNLDNIENLLENRYYVPNNNSSSEKPKFKPTAATQNRLRAKNLATTASVNTEPDSPTETGKKLTVSELEPYAYSSSVSASGTREMDYVKQPFKNPETAYKEAMNFIAQEDWEKKCQAMNIIRRLSAYHEDLTINNIHTIVLALVAEVRNLRSQVSRFGLVTFGDLFTNLKKNMDIDLDISVKTILQKNAETNDFIKADVEKCLEKMTNNVTTHKGLIALINGGATHRNPSIRRTTAQFVYRICELMGPGKILSGIKDVTEKILITASQFVVDGPVDIRWYGRKIFYMLMSHDEFDRLLVKHLNEKTRKDIKEILDTVKVKGPGDVPTESARNSRKSIRQSSEQISRSAGNQNRLDSDDGFNSSRRVKISNTGRPPHPQSAQNQETIKNIGVQLRNTDFRERIDAIEKFQVACEMATDLVVVNIIPLFDKFNPSLADSNSKVNYKALNTMFQITPILADNLSPVIANVIPIVAQNLASKNSEIQDLASNILDIFIEYMDGSLLIQPFTNLAMHANTRIRPQLVFKLADLISSTYSRKQKQVELHVLPCVWALLASVKGNNGSALTAAFVRLAQNLYEQMGESLIEKAAASSSVPAANLQLLKEFIHAPVR